MNTNKNEEASDYGEPWALDTTDGFLNKVVSTDGKCVSGLEPTRRAIQCVNACAGITDPAAELAAMRGAIKEAHAALQNRVNSEGCSCEDEWSSPHIRARHSAACNATKSALAKLQPFVK